VDNVTLKVFTLAVEAERSALLPYEEMRFHPNYRPADGDGARKPSTAEILDAFPQVRAYMKKRRRTVRAAQAEAEKLAEEELRATLALIQRADCDRAFLSDIAKRTYRMRMERFERELKRIGRFLWEDTGDKITQADVERAKEYPIRDLITVQRRDGFVKCPFHDEKTGSLKVFKDNHWWCFGACQEGGDVIDLVMKMDGLKFLEAVRKLSGKGL
jgi:Spy/CpxP family protein refolding chaperone